MTCWLFLPFSEETDLLASGSYETKRKGHPVYSQLQCCMTRKHSRNNSQAQSGARLSLPIISPRALCKDPSLTRRDFGTSWGYSGEAASREWRPQAREKQAGQGSNAGACLQQAFVATDVWAKLRNCEERKILLPCGLRDHHVSLGFIAVKKRLNLLAINTT